MSRRRDEQGAVAIIFAFTAVVLLVVAALSVDLGQAWAEKRQQQHKSDMATLAGAGLKGADLPAPATGGTCTYGVSALASHQAAIDVAAYLGTQPGNSIVTATQLTDCNVDNGEIFYGIPSRNATTGAWTNVYNKNQLSLVSPKKHVDYGLARLIGFTGVDVYGSSTIEIKSPKMNTLPFYAFSGCDYGPQTLQQPNNGHSADLLMLSHQSETNAARLTSVTPSYYPAGTVTGTLQPIDIVFSAPRRLDRCDRDRVLRVRQRRRGSAAGHGAAHPLRGFHDQRQHDPPQRPARPDQGCHGRPAVLVHPRQDRRSVVDRLRPRHHPQRAATDDRRPAAHLWPGQQLGQLRHAAALEPRGRWRRQGRCGQRRTRAGQHARDLPLAGAPTDGTCSSSQTATVLWPTAGTNCVDTDTGMSAKVATGGFLGIGSVFPGHGTVGEALHRPSVVPAEPQRPRSSRASRSTTTR